jgi:NAD(P)-dependent dehydrogenase (short-subunit alcohol dehydrogenase family)
MKTVLITGTNRGIGLEFVRQYAMDGWRVFACCRNPLTADALNRWAEQYAEQVTVYRLDVADRQQIDQLARTLSDQAIDLLINNAGIYPPQQGDTFGRTDYAAWAYAFEVNTMAPLKMSEAFVRQISRSQLKTIITITSKMGSIEDNRGGGSYIYRASKAAVNIVMKSLSIDLNANRITAVLLHPGWVRTDMGGSNGLISAEQSVTGMRRVIGNLEYEDSGKCYAFDGQIVPW